MKTDQDLFFLMQMADSAFPVGGFAYSYGLESAVKHGLISDQENLREYLITFSEQLISFDFPFVCSAFEQSISEDDLTELTCILNSYQAMLLNPPVRKAGCVIGKNWLRICKQISIKFQLDELDRIFNNNNFSYDFPVIFGLCMNALKFTLQQTLHLFFYMAIRDQISALIRLGIAGPSRAHMELQKLLEIFADRINYFNPVSYEQAHKSAYLLELVQLSHDRVYSKLFQN